MDGLCQAAQTVPAREFAQALRRTRLRERAVRPSTSSSASAPAMSGGRGLGAAFGGFTQWVAGRVPPASGGNTGVGTSVAARSNVEGTSGIQMRAITQEDFNIALGNVRPTGKS